MNLNQYTEKAQESLQTSQGIAQEHGQQNIEPEHLLYALLTQDGGIVAAIVTAIGANVARVTDLVQRDINGKPKIAGSTGEVKISREVSAITDKAETEAKQMRDDFVSTEHLLIALADASAIRSGRMPNATRILNESGVNRDSILKALVQVRGNQRVTSQQPEATYQSLEKYGRDLTQAAQQGKLDPVIGRDEEIRRVIQILSPPHQKQPGADW